MCQAMSAISCRTEGAGAGLSEAGAGPSEDASAVRNPDQRYRKLFDAIDQGCCIVRVEFDSSGCCADYVFLEVNQAFERETGIAQAVGRSMRTIAPDHEEFWFDTYGRVARTGVAERFQHSAAALGHHYDVYAFRLGEPAERQVAILFTDIGARMRHEADLQEADRRKNAFLAMLGHELRNPLAPLRAGLHLLEVSDCDRAVAQRLLPMFKRQVQHMIQLIDDLMDVSRISGGKIVLKRETVDLASVLESAVETSRPLVDAAHHTLHLQVPAGPLRVHVDPIRMSQVFANLLNNAAKYTPEHGEISLRAHLEGQDVTVTIEDNGIGIAPELLPRIFDLFAQADPAAARAQGGIGVGLALVRELVQLHGGSVQAFSDGEGRGSAFKVLLPCVGAQAEDEGTCGVQGSP